MTLTAGPDVARQPPERDAHVVMVDDHQLLAQSLAVALEMEGVSCDVAELHSRESLMHDVLAASPDLVLLDLDLGCELGDGSTLVAPLAMSGCRVMVVSASTDHDQICRAIEAGALGALNKSAPFHELLDAVLAVARGEYAMPAAERRSMLEGARRRRADRARALAPFERLSGREEEVLRSLAEGRSVGAIARLWCVSEETVRTQVRAIRTKLGVASQLEAVALAHRSGWLAPDASASDATATGAAH